MVVHAGGLTWSRPILSNGLVLVSAPNAGGGELENDGTRIDAAGFAVVPYSNAYRVNRIRLNTATIDPGLDLTTPVVETVPTQGAITMARFETRAGRAALVTLTGPSGSPPPFGATARDAVGKEIGTVGENGELFARGLENNATLHIQTTGQALRCPVVLPKADPSAKKLPFVSVESQCVIAPDVAVNEGKTL